MQEPLDEVTYLKNEAIARLTGTRRTFTEREALKDVWNAGYEVSIQSDSRFVLAQEQGKQPGHWRLSSHTLANNRLLNDLLTDTWDGHNLDAHLAELDAEAQEVQGESVHHVYCPLDPRLMLNAQGKLELKEQERNISIPPSIKSALDALADKLLRHWRHAEEAENGSISEATVIAPWTLRTIVGELRSLGWQDAESRNAHLYVRTWLLHWPAVVRVGQDYWLPADALPQDVQRTRLRVLPIFTAHATPHLKESSTESDTGRTGVDYRPSTIQRVLREHSSEQEVIIEGRATAMRAVWSHRLRTAHLLEGFLPIPVRACVALPPPAPGEQECSILQGVWFDDNTHFWLWLDREKFHFYGPMLAEKLAWQMAGDIVHIEWEPDVVVFRITGHDDEVENEESRLVDLDALSILRGGLGESYRRSLQEILSAHSEGLHFGAIVTALRERQQHKVHRGTVHALLYSGDFVQRERRWFAAPDSDRGARHLRQAFVETLVIEKKEKRGHEDVTPDMKRERVRAIRTRLAEIVERLDNPFENSES